jgi:hypothetical protein
MSDHDGTGSENVAEIVSASCPGGMARQFRVQVESDETLSRWRLAGSFGDAEAARRFAATLSAAGQHPRVIACRALPTAA